ncbi:MAG: type II toxin-antitoxin system RelE/ParE family toxin [Bacteroidetes bacterium]|nr:type II toxin-antitoxin system RelE/ParE family toxin [Bacteroidota bacterium]
MNTNKKFRTAVFYKDYFEQFFVKQNNRVKEKIIWTIRLVEDVEVVHSIYLKSITGTNGIYEIRIQTGSDIFRIFCFFDKENIIVIGNGFQKKTQKTPKNEIIKAIQIKLNYENEK